MDFTLTGRMIIKFPKLKEHFLMFKLLCLMTNHSISSNQKHAAVKKRYSVVSTTALLGNVPSLKSAIDNMKLPDCNSQEAPHNLEQRE